MNSKIKYLSFLTLLLIIFPLLVFSAEVEIQIEYPTTPPVDTLPPVRSSGQPTGTLPAGTTQISISLSTNENATCKYSTNSALSYDSMTNNFSATGGTSHSTSVTGLSNGNNYAYYVKCSDAAGNKNTDNYLISFSVASPASTPCVDCGLGTPVINPISPKAGQSFTITCSANSLGYDCINAFVDGTQCTYSQWSGTNVIFSCSGLYAGNYNARCNSRTGTSSNCCLVDKTATFTVQVDTGTMPPPTPPPPAPPAGGPSGGTPTGGGGGADTVPPIISEVKVINISSFSATITWITNESASSQVEYGTSSSYGSFTNLDSSLIINHSPSLNNLNKKILYHFIVISKDASGNESKSTDNVFTTLPIGDFNGDGKVNIYDLSILLSNWKTTKARYDLNNDGLIQIFDLSILLSNWTK
jgi:hypothetical protein